MQARAPAIETVSRPPKMPRRETPDREAGPEKMLHFDVLKGDENGIIARYMSSRPNAKNWPTFIEEEDVATLYYIDGDLGRLVCSTIRTLGLKLTSFKERNHAISIADGNPSAGYCIVAVRT